MAEKGKALQASASVHIFGSISAEHGWTPAVNVYDCGGSLQVCVELAGVTREAISVTVEPGRLIITGRRDVPEPEDKKTRCLREMEIDHGVFRRVLVLPDTVDLNAVESRYTEGMLWVVLPIKR